MRFLKFSLQFFAFVLLISCSKVELKPDNLLLDINGAANSAIQPNGAEFVPNEMLVKFKKGTTDASRGRIIGLLKANVKEHIHTAAMKNFGDEQGVFLLSINENALDGISRAKAFGEIEYAEPNWVYHHDATSNDLYFSNGSLWGMYGSLTSPSNQYGSGAAAAWASGHTGINTVWVGIIDEGYMFSHEDLTANAGINPGEIAGNGSDDDGNGYKDDVYGWDFDGNNNTVFDGTGDDHGTHVAGTIGGVGGNGVGVAGINWTVKILNAKFLGSRGGTTANAIKAVDYFTDLKKRAGINLVATNNSWGGGGFSQGLYDAIERSKIANILFIAAAGNGGSDGIGDNNDLVANYPSNYANTNIIAVAAINSTGALASFSNYGSLNVDLGAPGYGINSTIPVKSSRTSPITSGYTSYSGTSMATPHVTGAAALYSSTHPGSTAAQIKGAILGAATPTASLAGKCVSEGRLNVSGF
jgi:subtilisin family serine protease